MMEKNIQKNVVMETLKRLSDSWDGAKTLSIFTEEYINITYNAKELNCQHCRSRNFYKNEC